MASPFVELEVGERVVKVTNPDKVLFPARKETKLAVMEHFTNSRLLEGYGSTEAGWVTLLRSDEQRLCGCADPC